MSMHSANKDYQKNADVFGGYWAQGGRRRRAMTYAAQTKLRRFRSLLRRWGFAEQQKLQVFDQGFGAGDMLFSFDESASLAGEELSAEDVNAAIAEAARRGYSGADFRVFRPGRALPAEWREAFDFLISSHVLEHMEHPEHALRELFFLLKPGAYACLVVPINEERGEDENHFHWFTEPDFCAMIKGVGFEVVEVKSVDRFWTLLAPAFYRRQRRPRSIWRVIAIAQNLATFALPGFALRTIDCFLALAGIRPRQCFVLCRRPSHQEQ